MLSSPDGYPCPWSDNGLGRGDLTQSGQRNIQRLHGDGNCEKLQLSCKTCTVEKSKSN